MNRISVLGRYFRNDRIKEYEEILKSATEHGYIVTSLEKYMGIMSQADIKVLVDKDAVNNVIGKGGKVAKAIRTIVKSAAQKSDKSYGVYVEER